MGRAGGGSRSSFRASGGGFRSSRSGGGHRVGRSSSGSRAGRGSRSYSSNDFNGLGSLGNTLLNSAGRSYGRSYRYGNYSTSYQGGSLFFVAIVVIALLVFSTFLAGGGGKAIPSSTILREKLDTNVAFVNNCIDDQLNWFDNETKTETRLKSFYDKTGIQPYILLKTYDPSLTTDNDKEKWALNYYDNTFSNENVFLYVYFAEEDQDVEVGYMCYVNGKDAATIMDAEAVDIFWSYIDSYWTQDISTDDLFVYVFDKTAKRIMKVSTTTKDIILYVVIGVIVLIVLAGSIFIMLARHKRAKEKAEEDIRILNSSVDTLPED